MPKRPGSRSNLSKPGRLRAKKQRDIAFGVEFIDIYRETDISTAVTNAENANESNHMRPTAVGPFILPSSSVQQITAVSTPEPDGCSAPRAIAKAC
jgi:hypothetical protein